MREGRKQKERERARGTEGKTKEGRGKHFGYVFSEGNERWRRKEGREERRDGG